MKISVIGVNGGGLDMKSMGKSVMIAYIITFAVLALLSILITYTSMSINFANIGILLTVCISTFFGGYIVAKKAGNRGLLNGAIAGVLYVLLLYVIGAVFFGKFSFERNMIIMTVVAMLSSGFGGVVGVNRK